MIEARIFSDSQGFTFALFDTDDILIVEGETVAEQIYEHDKHYIHEETAERHAAATLERFNTASDSILRSLCGYDSVAQCKHKRIVGPVGNRNTPSKP